MSSKEEQQPGPSSISREEQQPDPSGVSQEEQQPAPTGVSQEELASPSGMIITHAQRPPQGTGSKPSLKSKKRKHPSKTQMTISISPEERWQWKQKQREINNARKKAIYEEILLIVENTHEWIFGDTTSAVSALRALRRRDLDGIAQAAHTFDEFYYLCRKMGLFNIEPSLWDTVYALQCKPIEWNTDTE